MNTTFDKNGQVLTHSCEALVDIRVPLSREHFGYVKVPVKYRFEYTRDSEGRVLTYKDSSGFASRFMRNLKGDVVCYSDSTGYLYEQKFNEQGQLTQHTNNRGVSIDYGYEGVSVQKVTHQDGHGYELTTHPDGEKTCKKF